MKPRPPRRRPARALLLLPLLLVVATSFPARAARAADAWCLGVDAVFSTVEAARVPGGFGLDQTARGLGLRAGRNLGERWRVQANVSGSDHRTTGPDATVRLTRATLELSRHLRPGHQLRPWLLAGAGWFHAGSREAALACDADGPGLVAAAGWELRLHGRWHLRGAARVEAVRWSGGPALPTPLFDRWQASSQVVAGLTIVL